VGVIVEWGNSEKTIIVITRTEPWTWEQFRETGTQVLGMLDSVQHDVSVIDNLEHNTFMPPGGFVENTKWAAQTYHVHPNVRVIVDVLGGLPKDLLFSARQLYGAANRCYVFVQTLQQAYELLAHQPINGCA
jgi:hypothetical protein